MTTEHPPAGVSALAPRDQSYSSEPLKQAHRALRRRPTRFGPAVLIALRATTMTTSSDGLYRPAAASLRDVHGRVRVSAPGPWLAVEGSLHAAVLQE